MAPPVCETAEVPGVLFLPLLFLAIALVFTAQRKQTINRAWTAAGAELGLDARVGGYFSKPEISGRIDGIGVRVDVRSGSGDNDSNYTRYRAHHESVGPTVTLRRQGALSFFGRLIGRHDLVVGDPLFDDKVVVDTTDDAAVREFLTPARRAAVLGLFERWRSGEVTRNSIEVETAKIETDAKRIVATVLRLVDTAVVLGAPAAVDAALTKRQDGDIAASVDDLHAVNQQRPNIFTETLEAEALVELGDHEGARAIFDGIDQRVAAVTDTPGWSALAATPAPAAPPPAPFANPEDSPPSSDAVAQQALLDDLFDPTRLSHQIVERFEQSYANTVVSWTGEVTAAHHYRNDLDFGAGPGVKARVLLGGTGRSKFVSNEVHAVVDFAEGTEIIRGSRIAFTGTLARVDRFARKLYVTGARLIEG